MLKVVAVGAVLLWFLLYSLLCSYDYCSLQLILLAAVDDSGSTLKLVIFALSLLLLTGVGAALESTGLYVHLLLKTPGQVKQVWCRNVYRVRESVEVIR